MRKKLTIVDVATVIRKELEEGRRMVALEGQVVGVELDSDDKRKRQERWEALEGTRWEAEWRMQLGKEKEKWTWGKRRYMVSTNLFFSWPGQSFIDWIKCYVYLYQTSWLDWIRQNAWPFPIRQKSKPLNLIELVGSATTH